MPLGTPDLQRYMEQRGIRGAVVPPLAGAPPPPGCVEVKSLVFLVGSHPLVLVLPLAGRVDERRLAALLHTSRSRLRLAPAASLVQLCGYPVGCVPPFGHRHPLPVIVDSAVAAHESCYAGGGSEAAELLLPVPELLRAAAATVADISSAGGGGGHDDAAAAAAERAAVAAAALPQPWQAGQEEVVLEGLVAQRRRIARLLLFATLVPLAAAGAPADGAAAYLRRLWRHPGSGRACEVQLILGASLERRLGSDAAAQLLRSVRPGRAVRVAGRVQEHLQRGGDAGPGARDVCDLVVSSLEFIEAPAPPAEAPSEAAAGQAAAAAAEGGDECYQLPPQVAARVVLVEDAAGLAQLERELFPGSCTAAGSAPRTAGTASSDCAASVSNGQAGREEGQEAGQEEEEEGSTASSPRGFASGSGGDGRAAVAQEPPPQRLVVGLDCEWQPYGRGEPHTPVSLLQIATPGAVFLLDLLALCGSSSPLASCAGAAAAAEQPQQQAEQPPVLSVEQQPVSVAVAADQSPVGAGRRSAEEQLPLQPRLEQLPPEQQQLSAILERLFGDASVVKAGFGLATDLARLCESYPHLPCFGARGAVPLRSHVDVLLLARTALGPRLPSSPRRRPSLAALAQQVLGCPLDKSEQCSGWGERPLTPAQLRYAAADAHALVALHEALHARRQGLRSPFWTAQFAGGLSDVHRYHPANRRPRESSGRRARRGDAGADRTPRRAAAAVGEGERRQGQTGQLEANTGYLLASYLGRQLPQGGKAAVVRAAAAASGRRESGRTPSFPRGCGGLLEWRNAFTLFVTLPQPGQPPRTYPNEFFWLPPAEAAEAAVQPGGPEGAEAGSVFAAPAAAVPVLGVAPQDEAGLLAAGWRLAVTWWAGRGQTEEHPAVRRLLAAGGAPLAAAANEAEAAGGQQAAAAEPHPQELPAAAASAADGAATSGEADFTASDSAQPPPAVLLFCRGGSTPYVFCGRLQPIAVGTAPSGVAAYSSSRSGCCITWELADGGALLGSAAFRTLLQLPPVPPPGL